MKAKLLIPILTGVLFAAAANAQEDITITGSTAARSIVFDRVATLFDPGFTLTNGDGTATALGIANKNNKLTVSGTMSSILGATPVTVRFSMSGSAQGISDLDTLNPLSVINADGTLTTKPATIAFADNWPEACSPSIPSSHFTANTNLMVLPFVYFRNLGPDMASVTNITKEQAIMLLRSSGTVGGFPAMPASFLGSTSGTATNVVYLFGRDIGSGTRIGVFKDTGFTGTPRQWATNNLGQIVLATDVAGVSGSGVDAGRDGFASGGNLVKAAMTPALASTANVVGYAGEADANGNGSTPANWLKYEGFDCNHTNVANGQYPIWCYEHVYARAGALTANQNAIFNAIKAALTETNFQATNVTVFRNNAVALSEMKVKRGVDGGSFTTTPAAGF